MINSIFFNGIFRIIYGVLIFFLFLSNPTQIFAGNNTSKANVIVFAHESQSVQMNAIAGTTVMKIKETCNRLGRFLPVEDSVESYAYNVLIKTQRKNFTETAEKLGLDFYIAVKISPKLRGFIGTLEIVPVNKDYIRLKQTITVDAAVIMNIPFKLCRELAYLHQSLPLRAAIIKKISEQRYIIDAGQWHGLKEGTYRLRNGSSLKVISTGRYSSLAEPESAEQTSFLFELYPDVGNEVSRLERRMELNIDEQYGSANTILKSTDAGKQFVRAACVINPGANACLPGYGSYLATEYMGFKKTRPDYAGILTGTGVILSHLTLTEFMTGFRSNFFPWIRDDDKSAKQQRLQWFMFGTLPLGMTASYFHQLSSQYEYTRHLPPFFETRDEAAVCFSVIVPGGGLFYKGYRFTGWAYYFSEIFLGGYGTYHSGQKKSIYAFGALGLIKGIEIIHAAFAPVAYDFYQREIRRGDSNRDAEFLMSVNTIENEDVLKFGLRMYLR